MIRSQTWIPIRWRVATRAAAMAQASAVEEVARALSGERVLVLGSPGSGKTCFAGELARLTGLPHFNMDDLYWRAGWRRPDPEVFCRELDEVLARPRFILDGNYLRDLPQRMPHADAVVLLDMPTWVCLRAVAWRELRRYAGHRASLPLRVRDDPAYRPRLALDFRFASLVLHFRRRTWPQVHDLVERTPGRRQVFVIRRKPDGSRHVAERAIVEGRDHSNPIHR